MKKSEEERKEGRNNEQNNYIEVRKKSRFCTRPQLAIELHLLCLNSITRKLTQLIPTKTS